MTNREAYEAWEREQFLRSLSTNEDCWTGWEGAIEFAYRASCPFCAADWPVEYSHGECPVIHVRPAALWRNPSADHVQCQAARLRALAEGWSVNPLVAAESGDVPTTAIMTNSIFWDRNGNQITAEKAFEQLRALGFKVEAAEEA